jgi:ribonuclease P protein component
VDNLGVRRSSILASRPGKKGARSSFSLTSYREADLPAKRAPPEATARIPRSHGDAGRPGNPEATEGPGPQAALRLTQTNLHRRHRLSRSRDFDAVYRHGRSVSTRFLVLYWFPREDGEEPRLGIAVPKGTGGSTVRSKIKRQLRETWRSRLETLPPACDCVLIVRPGLVEGTQSKGFEWLGERVDEVLGKAAA